MLTLVELLVFPNLSETFDMIGGGGGAKCSESSSLMGFVLRLSCFELGDDDDVDDDTDDDDVDRELEE